MQKKTSEAEKRSSEKTIVEQFVYICGMVDGGDEIEREKKSNAKDTDCV